jgi:hypothetical protein
MLWLEYLQAADWAALGKTVLGAGIGTGVVQGSVAICRERRCRKVQAAYLALRLAVMLEAFAIACADLIRSNSVAEHLPEHEFPDWDIKLPQMLAYPEDGASWVVLDRRLANRCLSLRNKRDDGQRLIYEQCEHEGEGLKDVITQQASGCGLAAWHLAQELRLTYGVADPTLRYEFADYLAEAGDDAAASMRQRAQRKQATRLKLARIEKLAL